MFLPWRVHRWFGATLGLVHDCLMNVLVLNRGSYRVKFQLIDTDLDRLAQTSGQRLARGSIDRVGGEAIITMETEGRTPQRSTDFFS